jgi:hypothetical protein
MATMSKRVRKLARSQLVQDVLSKVLTAAALALVAKLMGSRTGRSAERTVGR